VHALLKTSKLLKEHFNHLH